MNKIYNPKKEDWPQLLKRPTKSVADIETTVNQVFEEVQKEGDTALIKYTQKFDGILLDKFLVSESEIKEALGLVSGPLKDAIGLAKQNIEIFHKAQQTSKVEVETAVGVQCWQEKRPIQKVWLIHSGRNSTFVFYYFDVGSACNHCRLYRNCTLFAAQ